MFEEKEVRTIGQYFNMKIIFSFVAGVVAGVLFAVPLVERGKFGTDFFAGVFKSEEENILPELGMKNENPPLIAEKQKITAVLGENSLVVNEQNSGLSVVMSMVLLSQSGWVAVHEETPEGAMGNILGARRFAEGTYFSSSIDLLRATEGGRMYYAVLHGDDGDNTFNFETEVPARDASLALIAAKFIATQAE